MQLWLAKQNSGLRISWTFEDFIDSDLDEKHLPSRDEVQQVVLQHPLYTVQGRGRVNLVSRVSCNGLDVL